MKLQNTCFALTRANEVLIQRARQLWLYWPSLMPLKAATIQYDESQGLKLAPTGLSRSCTIGIIYISFIKTSTCKT